MSQFRDYVAEGRVREAMTFLGHWAALRYRTRVVRPAIRRLYRDPYDDVRRSVLIAGNGRSGTTWLADIVGSMLPSRIMFEPFHSGYVSEFDDFNLFHYARPDEDDERLMRFCQLVFSGRIRHPWIDQDVRRIFPKHRVIKDIRANLFLKWIRVHFSGLPIIFVIRHPCAVVLSRMQGNWATDSQLQILLSQPKLVEDFLSDKLELIERAQSTEEKHAVIWSIFNLVPLRQFQSHELNIVFYENLCVRPEQEVQRIVDILRASGIEPRDIDEPLKRLDTPSSTTRQVSAVLTGRDKVRRWRGQLSEEQTARVLSTVEAFGLSSLYGDSDLPITGRRKSPRNNCNEDIGPP